MRLFRVLRDFPPVEPRIMNKKLGLQGWTHYYNDETVLGLTTKFLLAFGIVVVSMGAASWKINQPTKLAAAKKKKDDAELYRRQVEAWVANGKSFERK